MKYVMLMSFFWITNSYGQWTGAESLQRKESGILGGYYYSACIAQLDKPSAMLYGERISNTDINFYKLLLNGTLAGQNFLVGFEQEHGKVLQKSQFSFGFGKRISPQVNLGIRVGYDGITAAGYGSKGKLTSGFGLFLKATDHILWALQLNHLESLKEKDRWQYVEGRVGMGWVVSDACGLSLALEISETQKANLEVSLLYLFMERARVRMEFDTKITGLKASLGYRFPVMELEFFSQYQLTGNTSYGIGLFHQFKKRSA